MGWMTAGDVLCGGRFERRGRPAAEQTIISLEATLGVRLPAAYRAFLLEGDGARFRQYNEISGAYHGGLREVFAVDDPAVTGRSLGHILQVYAGRVPADLLPVGDDLAGNLICLAIAGDHAGRVFFWDHEMEADGGDPPTMDNMELVADSFTEFVGRVIVEDCQVDG